MWWLIYAIDCLLLCYFFILPTGTLIGSWGNLNHPLCPGSHFRRVEETKLGVQASLDVPLNLNASTVFTYSTLFKKKYFWMDLFENWVNGTHLRVNIRNLKFCHLKETWEWHFDAWKRVEKEERTRRITNKSKLEILSLWTNDMEKTSQIFINRS